jgi:signal transduction histidine kinase
MQIPVFRFADRGVEREFRRYYADNFMAQTRFASLLGTITAAAYLLVDGMFLNRPAADFMRSFRYFYMIPVPLAWVLLLSIPRLRQWWMYWVVTATGIPIGWSFAVMTQIGGVAAFFYGGVGLLQVSLFLCLLLRIPASLALPGMLIMLAPFYFVIFGFGAPVVEVLNPFISVTSVSLLSIMLALRMERDQRAAYMNERAIHTLREQQSAADRDKIAWLSNVTGFLRHELRNAITGISSSVALIRRKLPDPSLDEYFARAQRSADFMRDLLRRTAEATSLEAALRDERVASVPLHELAADVVEHYRVSYSEIQFTLHGSATIVVAATEDRVRQALEKLLTNAVEHRRDGSPIAVAVAADDAFGVVSVTNEGDALPHDTPNIFAPFVGTKRTGQGENLGLGLYVARVIAEHFGGRIEAQPRPNGAEFRLRLPIRAPQAVVATHTSS